MARPKLLTQGGLFDYVEPEKVGRCAYCDNHTVLVWSETGSVAKNAHPGDWLCNHCDGEHRNYWRGMWEDYYAGLL